MDKTSSSLGSVGMLSKAELAMRYFPDTINKSVARHHLMQWITRNPELWLRLQSLGYRKGCQFFSPRMVACIYDYLGEP